MNKKRLIVFFVVFLLVLLLQQQAEAQCAMCRTSAESDLKTGGTIAKGLNTGILYLMAIPYMALMIGGYFFFRKSIDTKVKALKNKLFSAK